MRKGEAETMLNDYGGISRERMADILDAILNAKTITRSELAHKLNLSPSSIVKYINNLIELGLVKESGPVKSTGGRRSSSLEFDPEVGVNIALVFNLSSIEGALVNPAGAIVYEYSTGIFKGISREDLLKKLTAVIRKLKRRSEEIGKRIFGIGLGMGDHMDMKKGISHRYLLAGNWKDVPLKEIVESQFSLPFFLINDIDAGALGEKYYGRGKQVDNFAAVWLSETVGMGMILNGSLYFGKKGSAGEIGHITAVPGGRVCTCGNRGCLETVATESYVLERCREGLEEGVHSEIAEKCGGELERLTITDVVDASNAGDRFARNIFLEISRYIGEKLSDVANILNPECIILRGSVIDNNSFLFENIERIIKTKSLPIIADSVKLVYTSDKSDIRIPGVSSYILMNYFRQ